MHRNGEYENYKKFGVSREVEYKWLQEIQSEFLSKLKQATNNKSKAEALSDYGDATTLLKDIDGFLFMLEYVRNNAELFDSNTLLRNTHTILNTVGIFQNDSLKSNTIKEVLVLLKNALKQPIYISDDYKENGKLPDYLTVEKVTFNIKNAIQYWENI